MKRNNLFKMIYRKINNPKKLLSPFHTKINQIFSEEA